MIGLRKFISYLEDRNLTSYSNIHFACITKKNDIRRIVPDEFYAVVDENLSTEFGRELKRQRSIQVEGAFGVIKQDMKFTRFTRRGLKNAKMEFLIVCLGYNLRKYHKYRLKREKEEREKLLLN
ncbi:hypothetical protein B5E79_10520 [Massilimicrobiota sp. An134]|nr:hypothetical protein B5E79_10520 [Massilimicrobiota sp. An134]